MASMEVSAYRYFVSTDGISYLDMSDAVFPGTEWRRLITGTWSPLYPFLLGLGRLLRPDPYREIVTGHLINIPMFLAAFAAFEFFLRNVVPREEISDLTREHVSLPRSVYLVVGYTLFLWASIANITLRTLRADMLMTTFLLLAMGMLLRIKWRGGTWARYLTLGMILGFGYLAKAPILPIGGLILASSLLLAGDWKRTLPKALLSAIVSLAIGSLYFIPLSQKRGDLTLGESSSYNYLIHVDRPETAWYLQQVGRGSGRFLHSATKIFDKPAVYQFSVEQAVTYPMRFDPAYWAQGVKPRFYLRDQFRALAGNLNQYKDILERTGGLIAGLAVLWFVSGNGRQALVGIMTQWPLWFIGSSGLAMYALVHVEDRYVGVFFLLLWMGLLIGLRAPAKLLKEVAPGIAWGIATSILIPMIATVCSHFLVGFGARDVDAEAARELTRLGIHAGDNVARISAEVTDLAWARMLRVSIITEVDIEHADNFWKSLPDQQEGALKAMAATGARIVVAHISEDLAPAGWQRLGKTLYWLRWLNTS